MKKITAYLFLFLFISILLCSLSGCTQTEKQENEKLDIVTTIFPPYDFARQVCGEYADITMLVPPGSESHSFEPTLQDIAKINRCDIFIYAGGDSEEWVNDIIKNLDEKKVIAFSMSDCVPLLTKDEHHTDDGHEHHADETDEHVWTSPLNAIRITETIAEKAVLLDVEHADIYRDNAKAYIEKLNGLDIQLKDVTQNAKRKTLIFEGRFPFRYLCHDYGLDYYAAIDGCSDNVEIGLSEVNSLITKIKELYCPVIFHIEFSECKTADTVCSATGAKTLCLHSCHCVSKSEFENNVTYVSLMTQNIENLKEALN